MSKDIISSKKKDLESEKIKMKKISEIPAGETWPERDVQSEKEKAAESASVRRAEKTGMTAEDQPIGYTAAEDIITASRVARRSKKRREEIEKVLEKDLEGIYLSMLPDRRKVFRAAGERTAEEINKLLSGAKVRVKKIIDLIKKWLSMIPGVNKFFLEQEAKIKADEIIKIKQATDDRE